MSAAAAEREPLTGHALLCEVQRLEAGLRVLHGYVSAATESADRADWPANLGTDLVFQLRGFEADLAELADSLGQCRGLSVDLRTGKPVRE